MTKPAARRLAAVALACGATLGGAPLYGQTSGTIVGTVLDASTLAPLAGVRIELVGTDRVVVTDAGGRAAFEDVRPGDVTVRVAQGGYGTVVERLDLAEMETALIQFQLLPVAAVLDELLVQLRGDPPPGHSESRVTGDRIESMSAADLLAQRVPGLSVDRTSGAVGAGARVLIRGVSSMTASNAPAIYLDGIRIDDRATGLRGSRDPQAFHALEQIPASAVSQIRVLRGPAAAAKYAGAANGVIVIETRRGPAGG